MVKGFQPVFNIVIIITICLACFTQPVTAQSAGPGSAYPDRVLIQNEDGSVTMQTQPEPPATLATCSLAPPVLDSPSGITTTTLVPAFRWNGPTDQYWFQVSKTSSFSSTVRSVHWWVGSGNVSVTNPENLAPRTKYYWRVASTCENGASGAFSAAKSFTTGNINPPFLNPPAIYRPADGEVAGQTVNFSWQNISASGYRLSFYNSLEWANKDWPYFSTYSTSYFPTGTSETFDEAGIYYWRINVYDGRGWGPLSSVRKFEVKSYLADNTFRPNPDGYAFNNYGSTSSFDFGAAEMQQMFGTDTVCSSVLPVLGCQLNSKAKKWLDEVNKPGGLRSGGHCLGMSITSLRFFRGIDSVSNVQWLASETHDLWSANPAVRKPIAKYLVTQILPGISLDIQREIDTTPNAVVNELKTLLSLNNTDPVVLAFTYKKPGTGKGAGHAVVPYAIEQRAGGIYWVMVYDNNYPDSNNQKFVFDTNANTWSYRATSSSSTLTGGAGSIALLPISIFAQPDPYYTCPWCSPVDLIRLPYAGGLVTDESGNRLGYADGVFYNEIPDGFELPQFAGQDDGETWMAVPAGSTYTIDLSGSPDGDSGTHSVSFFGPDFAIAVEDITLSEDTQDQIVLPADGRSLSYQTNEEKSITVRMGDDRPDQSVNLDIKKIRLAAGQSVGVTVDAANGRLDISKTGSEGDGTLGLRVSLNDGNATHAFSHRQLPISTTGKQVVNYADWTVDSGMELGADTDGDGEIDQITMMENQEHLLFLPLMGYTVEE